MPICPELRPLYPPHWRELSRHVRFERAQGQYQGCGRPIWPVSGACRMGAGSTRPGQPGSEPPASCSRPRTSTATPPTTVSATCGRAATCCTIGRTISRSGGSPTGGAGRRETSSSGSIAGQSAIPHDPVWATGSPPGYADWLADLKDRIRQTRLRVALAVNSELILLY